MRSPTRPTTDSAATGQQSHSGSRLWRYGSPMGVSLDHVVLWCADPLRSVDFYQQVVGLSGERVDEFRDGRAPFPSVRISSGSLIDLMSRDKAASVDAMVGGDGTAGHPVNHVCLAMSRDDFDALQQRLAEHGTAMSAMSERSFGAQGLAAQAFYFRDPDDNVIEARHYPAPVDEPWSPTP